MSDISSDTDNSAGNELATDENSKSESSSSQTNCHQLPNKLENMESQLRLRSQKLKSRLRETRNGMADNSRPLEDEASVEQQARQLMRTFGPLQHSTEFNTNVHILAGQRRPNDTNQNVNSGPVKPAMPVMPVMPMMPAMPGMTPGHILFQPAFPVIHPIPMMAPQLQMRVPAPAPLPVHLQQPNGTEKPKLKKSKRALNIEVDALKELVHTLSSINPDIHAYTGRLIQHSQVLSQLDWSRKENSAPAVHSNVMLMNQVPSNQLRRVSGGNEVPSTLTPPMIGMAQQQHQIDGRLRRESEMSGSSITNRSDSGQMQSQEEPASHTPGKRNRKKHDADRKTKPRKQRNELGAMQAYINKIVQNYLGTEQLLTPEIRFDGEFSDLEAYAQRLVAAGYGRIIEEPIRVNRKNNRQAFICMSADRETMERDAIIMIPVARRYAFDGDTVRAFVLNTGAAASTLTEENGTVKEISTPHALVDDEDVSDEIESQDSDAESVTVIASDDCPKAFVICITKQTLLREMVGTIFFKNARKLGGDQLFYKFQPYDVRIPMAYVAQDKCAEHIGNKKVDDVSGLLYLAHVLETDSNGHCIAELVRPVGRVGNLEAELKAILLHNGLSDIKPFEQRFNDMYDQPAAPVSAADLEQREDLRSSCIFTIDPLTARDLDDALSIEKLKCNNFEVGVHISDVSHYLAENSELDNIVKDRSTSIYLVNEVIHMLPQPLCMRCSLLPGEDKFAFSVFWKISAEGEILGQPRFVRTVINSCTQFAYQHAQKMIDNPRESFTENDFPTIVNGFAVGDIRKRVLWMHKVAGAMRKRRFDNGALTINKSKLHFSLDPVNGEPLMFDVEKQREANQMIEEFMLLANQAVARFIYDTFPNISILRNHAPPLMKSMKTVREKMQILGLELDYSSSKAVQTSITKLCSSAPNPIAMNALLSHLLMKPMARAKYFCSENKTDAAELWHYALSIPIYTHFTSPIRRYPDIMVHRLLAAALKYCPAPARSLDELHALAKIANDRKYSAKQAGEESVNFYFKRFVNNKQGILIHAVIVEIFQHMLNVVTLESGHVIGINYKMQKLTINNRNAPNFILVAEHNSRLPPAKLQLLTVLPIRLIILDNKLTGFFLTEEQRLRLTNIDNNATKALTANERANFVSGFPQRLQLNNANDINTFAQQQQQQQRHNMNTNSPNINQRQQQQQQHRNRQGQQRIFALPQNSL